MHHVTSDFSFCLQQNGRGLKVTAVFGTSYPIGDALNLSLCYHYMICNDGMRCCFVSELLTLRVSQ